MEVEGKFMKRAIELAKEAAREGDYAVGAVVVKDNHIISEGRDTLKSINDPVNGHAEIDAIRKACSKLDQPYLEGCILYSTHEPCPMCASAAVWAKMKGIVFGTTIQDAKNKASKKFSWRQIDIPCRKILERGEPKLELIEGFMREDCVKLFELCR